MSKPFEKHTIYKYDKWNMLTVEVHGTRLIVREISDQWGEENHEFLSRPAMMEWAKARFRKERYEGQEEERERILEAFQNI